jgi:hypothetical protein
VLLAEGEFARRIGLCEDLLGSGRAQGIDRTALLERCAQIARDALGLAYESDGLRGRWVPIGETLALAGLALSRRTDNYLDRLLSDKVRSFPKIDTALIAFSFGLPLELWEAGNREAFNEFVRLEAARRRGARGIKPLLAFTPLDYLLSLAQDTPHLEVFDDMREAARSGMKAAREQLDRENASVATDADIRAARPVVNIPTVAADTRLWFRFCLAEPFTGPLEALLFEIFPSAEGSRASEGKAIGLLSTYVSHGGNLTFADVFESPTVPSTGVQLTPSENSDLILLIARKADLRSEPFFVRTRDTSASLELNDAETNDLRRSILRIAPGDRKIFRRRIRVR